MNSITVISQEVSAYDLIHDTVTPATNGGANEVTYF